MFGRRQGISTRAFARAVAFMLFVTIAMGLHPPVDAQNLNLESVNPLADLPYLEHAFEGDKLRKAGDLTAALEEYRSAIAEADEPSADPLERETWLFNLARIHQAAGTTERKLNNWSAAREHFGEALDLQAQLLVFRPNRANDWIDFTDIYNDVAFAHHQSGDSAAARELDRNRVEILEDRVVAFPDVRSFQTRLEILSQTAFDNSGENFVNMDVPEFLVRNLKEKLADAANQYSLFNDFMMIGDGVSLNGAIDIAKRAYALALKATDHLLAIDPENPAWIRAHAHALAKIASLSNTEEDWSAFEMIVSAGKESGLLEPVDLLILEGTARRGRQAGST